MTGRQHHKKPAHAARPIKVKRDFEAAAKVAKRLKAQSVRDTQAELRLQSLLHEMDKYDEPEDDSPGNPEDDLGEPGLARRWSDSDEA